VCGVVALVGLSIVRGLGATVSLQDPDRPQCPELPVSVHPSDVHFAPGLIEHQSWLDFPVPRQFTGYYVFCLDGRLLSSGGGDLDFHTGVARFNLPTRWVNLLWLDRRLDELRDPNRWLLGLACGFDQVCQ
jgi:hypothetical protein